MKSLLTFSTSKLTPFPPGSEFLKSRNFKFRTSPEIITSSRISARLSRGNRISPFFSQPLPLSPISRRFINSVDSVNFCFIARNYGAGRRVAFNLVALTRRVLSATFVAPTDGASGSARISSLELLLSPRRKNSTGRRRERERKIENRLRNVSRPNFFLFFFFSFLRVSPFFPPPFRSSRAAVS